MRIALGSLFIAAVALGNAACSSSPPPSVERPLAAKQAALVTVQFYDGDQPKGSCAGVLVGPQAVLTAGHCASNRTRAVVTAPNAGGRRAESHRAWWFDWTNEASPKSSPQLHDVAILSLDTPITLKKYPEIADDAVAPGAKTFHVRRVKSRGKTKAAFEAAPGRAQPQSSARSHYYKIERTDGSLDSGGPVFDAKTGKIVGVVSTRGGKSKALYVAKTKSLTKWLRQQLLALLENPPKPPAATSKTAPSESGGDSPSGSPNGGGRGRASGGGKMGKQAGKSTKAAGKRPSRSSGGSPQPPKAGEQDSKELGACEGGDMECDPDRLCGAAESTSSDSDNCDTRCQDDDESCDDPQCNESESCECEGETECGDEQDDPFEDPEHGDDDGNPDTEDDADDDGDSGDEGLDDAHSESDEDDGGGSDDYSESGYDDASGHDDSGGYGGGDDSSEE